jgi:hypothetical protein
MMAELVLADCPSRRPANVGQSDFFNRPVAAFPGMD